MCWIRGHLLLPLGDRRTGTDPFCLPQLWRRRGEIRPWLGKLLVLAALGMVLYQCLAYYAAHTTSATNMGVIGSLIPLLTLLQSALFFGQQ